MMARQPDMSKVTPIDAPSGADPSESQGIAALTKAAKNYLTAFQWCGSIRESYAGLTIPGVIGVYLFRIAPSTPDADEWLWVVVGDVPPAYITLDSSPNPATALDAYIGAMREWVEAVGAGQSVDGLIPVNAPATPHYAAMLESRLAFLDRKVLSEYAGDLEAH